MQDSSPADSRTGGLEDWYLSRLEDWRDLTLDSELKLLAAWWPLSRGAGGSKLLDMDKILDMLFYKWESQIANLFAAAI